MKRIRFHDLRHSCASLLYANGVRLKEIKVSSAAAIVRIFPEETKV